MAWNLLKEIKQWFISSLELLRLLDPVNQWWFMAVRAESLSFGSYYNILVIRDFAVKETDLSSGMVKSKIPAFTLFIISISFLPSNGGTPDKRMYIITPIDHISHFSSY